MTDLLIVGGGAAGFGALRGYREAGGSGPVTLVTDEPTLPYERPPLSKEFLRGDRPAGDLPLENPEFYAGVDVVHARVERVDPDDRTVRLADGTIVGYRAGVLATGNAARRLPVPGGDDPGLHHLRSLADAQRLRSAATSAVTAIVVGSGFVGCEVAASLSVRGVDVTLITAEHQPQRERLGSFAGNRIAEWLVAHGVRLVQGAKIEALSSTTVTGSGGTTYTASLVLVAVGVRPRTGLLRETGLLNEHGTVDVDAGLRTRKEGLYVAGDIAHAWHPAAGRRITVEHWTDAVRMGETAGANAAGEQRQWREPPGFWSTVGDRTLKYTGWGEGYDRAEPVSHGNGGFTVWYHRDGKLVGALTYQADEDYERAGQLLARP